VNLILFQPEEMEADGRVRLDGPRAAHMLDVLRAGPGKSLRVGLLNGPCGTAVIEAIDGRSVSVRCTFDEAAPGRSQVDLLLALPRPKVLKRLWAQLAALGVGRIWLTNAEKVERYYFDSHVLASEFYTAQLIEGLQQAGDTLLPEVRVIRRLKPFLEESLDGLFPAPERRLLADPSGTKNLFCGPPLERGPVLLAVGPEGGWTPYELDLFGAHGFERVNAGARILRTDTACVALLARLTLHSAPNEN
jgi:RsmE family RNA methyltransferase